MKYKKLFSPIGSVLLAAAVTIAMVPGGTAYAAQSAPKEEVIYANLNADGSVSEIYAVNSFDPAATG